MLDGQFKTKAWVEIEVQGRLLKRGSGPQPPSYEPGPAHEFGRWQMENSVFGKLLYAGLGRVVQLFTPEDAEKAIAWLRSQGIRRR